MEHTKKTGKEYPESNSPRQYKQAPANVILQRYREHIQRNTIEEEGLQGKLESSSQTEQEPVQREEKPNNTGLPHNLKAGIENLSGYNMDDVKVHYNSGKPAQLNALAYAQGTDIHVAPGQEKHLPHEAWHVVQQKQGRVDATMRLRGININNNDGLEKEADQMGGQALQRQECNKNSLKTGDVNPLVEPVQMWNSSFKNIINLADDEIMLYMVNETGSWHGHTVLVAEGWNPDGFGGGRHWYNTWSFEPEETPHALDKAFGGWNGGMKAKLYFRQENESGEEIRLSENREIGWSCKISQEAFSNLWRVINEEKSKIDNGTVKYVAIGHPIGIFTGLVKWEWHDNCNSWVNKVLRKSGIISSLWGVNYYLPSIPGATSFIYKDRSK